MIYATEKEKNILPELIKVAEKLTPTEQEKLVWMSQGIVLAHQMDAKA